MRWVIVGESRYGKSLLTSSLATRIFYQFEDCVGWLSDPTNQFYNISLPCTVEKFNRINATINNQPIPIPAIQLYMACKDIQPVHKDISFTLTLNFVEFLNKYHNYTHGIEDYKIKGSITYLQRHVAKLKNISDIEQFSQQIKKIIPDYDDKKNKGVKQMVEKWISKINVVMKEKFTSNLYKDDPMASDMFVVEFEDGTRVKGHPFIMAMIAGLVPIINAKGCYQTTWYRNYISDLIQKIMDYQKQFLAKDRKNMYLIMDELNSLHERGRFPRNDNVAIKIEEAYRQGAFNNIGYLVNTQSLEKINSEIYNNASHIACVFMKNAKDRKRLRDTFSIEEHREVDKVQQSLKKGEVMVFSKEPFTVYDRFGRDRSERFKDRIWFKGKIIPPLNHHEMPKKR